MTPASFMTGVSTVWASFQRAPMVTQRDWSNAGRTGITWTGHDSGEMLLIQLSGSKRLRGSGQNPLSV